MTKLKSQPTQSEITWLKKKPSWVSMSNMELKSWERDKPIKK